MRDRLTHLHLFQTDEKGFSTVELDQHAENEEVEEPASNVDEQLDGVLQRAQQIRLEIQQIQNDISELKDVNYQALNKTSYPLMTKRDSNAIGSEIKRRGEAVLHELHRMNDLRRELEAGRGSSGPAVRIARTQHQCLSSALQKVMFSYNDTEMSHREACKQQIQRQLQVVGREVSQEELEEMLSEEVNVFSTQMEGKTSHSALLQIQSRHQELLELEKRIKGVQELFLDVALLVEEQGGDVENIQKNVQNTEVGIQDGLFKLERATQSDKNNPFKKLFCSCFPCFYN